MGAETGAETRAERDAGTGTGAGWPAGGSTLRVLLAITLAGGLLRVLGLAAFPEVLADEGLWTNSTKNRLLFGDWFMDGRTHLFLSPLFHAVCLPFFALLGPGIATARLVSALAGTAAIPLAYLLLRRLTGSRELGLAAALLLAFEQSAVWAARLAQIEAFQVVWMLAAAVAVARPGRRGALAGGALFGLALLAKVNALYLLPILALWVAWPADRRAGWLDRRALGEAALFLAAALGLAGAVYGALYLADPVRFVAAHAVELEGEFAAALSDPIVSYGRFGLDPVQGARTVQALIAESPFLWVLAALGAVVALVGAGPRGGGLLLAWLALGTGFVLVQRFQPLRYFHVNVPALVGCATLALAALLAGRPEARRARAGLLALVVVFNLGFLGMNAATNPASKLREVTRWARERVPPDASLIASGYLCTDLPQRAYAWYHLAEDAAGLLAVLDELDVDFVVYDHDEWPEDWRPALDAALERDAEWPFGIAYRVPGEAPAGASSRP